LSRTRRSGHFLGVTSGSGGEVPLVLEIKIVPPERDHLRREESLRTQPGRIHGNSNKSVRSQS